MTPELMSLTWVAALSAIMWIPYILNAIAVRGIADAVGYPENPKPLAPWAQRMKAAHYNSVENLVLFATLVLVAHAASISNATTVLVCQVYFCRCPRACSRSSAASSSSSTPASPGRGSSSACRTASVRWPRPRAPRSRRQASLSPPSRSRVCRGARRGRVPVASFSSCSCFPVLL